MSIEAMRWAMDTGVTMQLEPAQRQILWLLGNLADPAGYLYPSITYISTQTGLAKRTVQLHCKAMETAGLYRRAPRPTEQGGRTSDGWYLAMKQPGLQLDPPRAESAPPPAAAAPPPVQRLHPPRAESAPELKELKNYKDKPLVGGTPPQFDEVWQAIPKRAGNNPRKLAERAYRARLAEGVAHEAVIAGAARYSRFIEATGKAGSEFVMQAATFLGPERSFLQPWTPPAAAPAGWWSSPERILAKAKDLGISTLGESADTLKNRIRERIAGAPA